MLGKGSASAVIGQHTCGGSDSTSPIQKSKNIQLLFTLEFPPAFLNLEGGGELTNPITSIGCEVMAHDQSDALPKRKHYLSNFRVFRFDKFENNKFGDSEPV